MEVPDSLLRQAQEIAQREGVSLEQFVASALAEKMAAWRTVEYLKERASRGDQTKFQAAMSRVTDIVPEELRPNPLNARGRSEGRIRAEEEE